MSAGSVVIDVRSVPFWHRLPKVLAAIDALPPDASLELMVDVDPRPLRDYLLATRTQGYAWEELESGPLVWRVRLSRRA